MDGKLVKIGGRDFIVPDATIETAENIAVRLEELSRAGGGVRRPMVVAHLISEALRENYPEMTGAEVAKILRFKEAGSVLRTVLEAAGLEMGAGAGEVGAP